MTPTLILALVLHLRKMPRNLHEPVLFARDLADTQNICIHLPSICWN